MSEVVIRLVLFLEQVDFFCSPSCISSALGLTAILVLWCISANLPRQSCHHFLFLFVCDPPCSLTSSRDTTLFQTFALFVCSIPLSPSFVSLPLFSVSPRFCPNWRLKREFFIFWQHQMMRSLWSVFTPAGAAQRQQHEMHLYLFMLFPSFSFSSLSQLHTG